MADLYSADTLSQSIARTRAASWSALTAKFPILTGLLRKTIRPSRSRVNLKSHWPLIWPRLWFNHTRPQLHRLWPLRH